MTNNIWLIPSVLHLLLWFIKFCLAASSTLVFYLRECPVKCKQFFNPRFVKSRLSPFNICNILINSSPPVLDDGPFSLIKLFTGSPFCLFLVLLGLGLYLFSGRLFSSNAKLLSVTQWLQTNEDLEGEVRFTSVVGPFAVPLRCTIKKCDVSSHKVATRLWR